MAKNLKEQVAELERSLMLDALQRARGIQSRAAGLLGISDRVFRYKLKKHNIKMKTKLLDRDIIVEIHVPSINQDLKDPPKVKNDIP